ncbi:hypothetical protein [Streptomyces spongiae]|uniref:Lipoprotein n=1 Tax=Streptomyces spongiae TaxID=565072 RepID=A0A5N8XFH3_9ACTN|nr:hypothetical protein [Streptomyces spongiae]MPY58189.1 hypothetical protein [Streptomyces spongiae]
MNRHLRKAVVVTAAITAGLLMTACQNDSSTTGSSSSQSSQSSSKSGSKSGSDSSGTSAGSSSGKKGSAQVANNASDSKSGVSGTFENGTVSYLAPGKYIVAVPGRTEQQFFVAEDTVVHGAGTICQGAVCTLDQLETATKKGAVPADVTLKNGIATVITERPAGEEGTGSGSGKGVSGTWLGQVKYLAPGKYTVSDLKDTQQAFFVAEDTVVNGAGTICGTEGSAETSRCTLDELEAAAKKGLTAKVELTNGIATTITEDH